MNGLDIFYSCLTLIAGVGVFLLGIKMMGDNLESLAGTRIKKMFEKLDKNIFVGVGIGAATTALIQSSGAVSAMAIGFVNSGFMSLIQATSIIFGANIGTTVTAQIIALGYGGLGKISFTIIFASMAGFGALLSFSKKDKVRLAGLIITGLGILFVGLNLMSSSMDSFTKNESVHAFISSIKHPLLLLFAGILATAILQSSSAFSGIIIAMCTTGLLNFSQAMYLIVGSNIGSCISALIASIGTSANGKRVAFIHVLFNVLGVTLFMLTNLFAKYDVLFGKMQGSVELKVALIHTLFNVVTVIVLMPFIKLIVKLALKVVPDKKEDMSKDGKHFYFVNTQLLKTPLMAIEQLKREILHMLELAMKNFVMAIDSIMSGDISNKNEILKIEDVINYLNKNLTKFMVEVSNTSISLKNRIYLGTAHHTVSDIERIGDYAINIFEYSEACVQENISFSESGIDEIIKLKEEILALYELVVLAYKDEQLVILPHIYAHEQNIDDIKDLMGANHISRLSSGSCTPEAGAYYLNLANDCERVGDHLTNIGNAIKSYAKSSPIRKQISTNISNK